MKSCKIFETDGRRLDGFTLMELLVVIGSIGVLCKLLLLGFEQQKIKPQITSQFNNFKELGVNDKPASDGVEPVRPHLLDQHIPDFQAVPTLARIWPTDNNVGVSGFCHGLLFYGLGPTDLPSYPSGNLMLKVLTDEDTAIQTFGRSPFVRTRNGLRYFLSGDPVFHTETGEVHRDQCLATFAALNLPLDTPIRLRAGSYSITDLLRESVANFSFDQHEPAWTAMAYAIYLPPKKEWVNRFGEQTSFSQLVQYLLKLDPNSQSCAGTHIFQALVKIDKADRHNSILDNETREQLDLYLTTILQEVVRHQQADGSWNWQWCDSIDNLHTKPRTLMDRILITGHLIEVLNGLDSKWHLPKAVCIHAAEWSQQVLNSNEIHANASFICPFTHAAKTAREVLRLGSTKEFGNADMLFRHTE